jgi:hypothetical protein
MEKRAKADHCKKYYFSYFITVNLLSLSPEGDNMACCPLAMPSIGQQEEKPTGEPFVRYIC